jgi:hypothetical protein
MLTARSTGGAGYHSDFFVKKLFHFLPMSSFDQMATATVALRFLRHPSSKIYAFIMRDCIPGIDNWTSDDLIGRGRAR